MSVPEFRPRVRLLWEQMGAGWGEYLNSQTGGWMDRWMDEWTGGRVDG